ncbi:MAG: type II toxin-antitoxin system ParD family antitoxin [Pseudomonas sp.]
MSTMNISLPDQLKAYVDSAVQDEGYSSASEYMRELIRQDQQRRAAQRLTALIINGLESGEPTPLEADFFTRRRERLQASERKG